MPCSIDSLLAEVRDCRVCKRHLPFEPKPILRAERSARLLIVGQAPGRRVHDTGIPWNDPSGARLRDWLRLEPRDFYDASRVAIIPTAFSYPGTGPSGDLPPRPECAPLWHPKLVPSLPELQIALLVGSYAQAYYLGTARKDTLTATVAAWREYLPHFVPLPHPSPRNQMWLKRNPWFVHEVLPFVRSVVRQIVFGD